MTEVVRRGRPAARPRPRGRRGRRGPCAVSACAQTAPNIPVEAPIAAAGLPVRALWPAGREAQSRAFLSCAGDRVVVLGGRDQDRVGVAHRLAQLAHRVRASPPPRRPRRRAGSRRSRSNSTSSTPAGSRSAAARSRALLSESRRRLPEMPRTRIATRLLGDELELDRDRHLVVEDLAAAGQLGVASRGRSRAGRRSASIERPTRALPARSAPSWAKRPLASTSRVSPRISSSPRRAALPSSPTLELGRAEAQLRVALGVEELGGEEVALQLLLVDVDAGDLDGALELRLLAAGQASPRSGRSRCGRS